MIDPRKLFQLEGGQKRRKLALTFGALERDINGMAEKGMEYTFSSMTRADYTKEITKILLKDPKLTPEAAEELENLLKAEPFDELALCNRARHHLLAIIGTFPAEWDLIIAPHAAPTDENGLVVKRDFYPGVCVYAEDIRSPFNIGSIFRTAEGMGAHKVYVSPFCIDPEQPRAVRSGMGCIETMGWERLSLDELPEDLPVFALETGGTPIDEFVFPEKGICVIGSEELGVSPQALKRCTYGTVTIPMKGLKASLNVGVAFGILMEKWCESLRTKTAVSSTPDK
ncbi:MAG: TrmH family RNA methyltransferase [Treponema sp.]|nr:TrmH family RNA methyltransferase [Treponema sp.]